MLEDPVEEKPGELLNGCVGNRQDGDVARQKGNAFAVEHRNNVVILMQNAEMRGEFRQDHLFVNVITQLTQQFLQHTIVKHQSILTQWRSHGAGKLEVVPVQIFALGG